MVPKSKTCAGHALAPPLLHEIPFQPAELPVYPVICLVNEADSDVGDDLRRTGLHDRAEVLLGQRCFAAHLSNKRRLFGILVPGLEIAGAEVVFVVIQQFLERAKR